jgi:hypothetical protein
MLPFPEPIGCGRWAVGVSEAITIHDIPTTRRVAAAPNRTGARRRRDAAAAHITTKAGSGMRAWASLTLNATPTSPAAIGIQETRRVWSARIEAHSAAISSVVITESIVSLREVSTEIGSTASANAARMPVRQPHTEPTAAYSSATAAAPQTASGR